MSHVRDRKWMLEVAGTVPPDELADMLRSALRGRSDLIREVAYRQVARLAAIPPDLAIDIRRTVIRNAANRTLRRNWLATRAQLMRLRPVQPFVSAAQLMYWVPFIDLVIHLVGVLAFATLAGSENIAWSVPTALVLATVSHLCYYPTALVIGRLGEERAARLGLARPSLDMRSGVSVTKLGWPIVALIAFETRGLVGISGFAAIGAVGVGGIILGVLFLLASTWSLAATHVALRDPPGSPLAWPFVHLRIARAVVSRLRRTTLKSYAVIAALTVAYGACLFGIFWVLSNVAVVGAVVIGIASLGSLALLINLIGKFVRTDVADWRTLRRWRRPLPSSMKPADHTAVNRRLSEGRARLRARARRTRRRAGGPARCSCRHASWRSPATSTRRAQRPSRLSESGRRLSRSIDTTSTKGALGGR